MWSCLFWMPQDVSLNIHGTPFDCNFETISEDEVGVFCKFKFRCRNVEETGNDMCDVSLTKF